MAVEHLTFHCVDFLVLAYSFHDLRAVGAQVISLSDPLDSVERLALLFRRVQQLLQI